MVSVVGVPRETKDGEFRVGLTPAVVSAVRRIGGRVLVQAGAGARAGFPDAAYRAAGAEIASTAAEVFEADLIVKVKEPNLDEVALLRPDQTLLAFVHLAGNPHLRAPLEESGASVLAYESVEDEHGRFPILAPMSHIAGRLSAQVGAHYLLATNGGRGTLLGPSPGVERSVTVVVGAGVVGTQAAHVAHGMGSRVFVIDRDAVRAHQVAEQVGAHATSALPSSLGDLLRRASLLIGAAHQAAEPAPRVVSREMIAGMEPGSVAVDVAIDEGGCFETSRPTSHTSPTFVEAGVVHYCVPNMPSMVAHSATQALCAVTAEHVLTLAQHGVAAFLSDSGWRKALVVAGSRARAAAAQS